jgi:hypothetical protein
VTRDVVERNKRFRAALSLISDFENAGYPTDNGARKLTPQVARTARELLQSLGAAAELPKMAPDEDGSLVMVWEHKDAPVLVVVEDGRIHLSEKATTAKATYHSDLPFDGFNVPTELLKALR